MFAKNLKTWADETDPHKQKTLISNWILGRVHNSANWCSAVVDTWRVVRDFQPKLLDVVSEAMWEGVSRPRLSLSELLEVAGAQFFYDRDALGYGDFIEHIRNHHQQHSSNFNAKQHKTYNWAEACHSVGKSWGKGSIPQHNMLEALTVNNRIDTAVFIAGCIRFHYPKVWDKSQELFTVEQQKKIGVQSLVMATQSFNDFLALQNFGLSFDDMVDVLEKSPQSDSLWMWFNHILYTPEIYMDGSEDENKMCGNLLQTVAEQFGDSIASSRHAAALIEFHTSYPDVSNSAPVWAQIFQKMVLERVVTEDVNNTPHHTSKKSKI